MDFILSKQTEDMIGKIIEHDEMTPEQKLEKEAKKKEQEDKLRIELRGVYEAMKNQYTKYIDMPNNYKTVISLWNIGTYLHNSFETFPFLFFNAMRGSGKTRTVKLTTNMCWEGQLLASLTESVLFRSKGTLAVDEFESIGSKEKQALRELLNAAYKKGIKIRRMKKVKKRNEQGNLAEEQEAEEFEAYRPVIMANIWGMEEVLADRCIQLTLEKSASIAHTKKIEDFTTNPELFGIKASLSRLSVVWCSVVVEKKYLSEWNNYIDNKYNITTTHNYTQHLTTHNNTELQDNILRDGFFDKIDATNLDGRHLELYFPLFIIAKFLGDDVLDEMLTIAKSMVDSKRIDDIMESKDIMFFDFISRKYEENTWISVNLLTKDFREFIGEEDDKRDDWLNTKWVGQALKRLCLVLQKRRLGRGVDVIISKSKADEKMKMFHN